MAALYVIKEAKANMKQIKYVCTIFIIAIMFSIFINQITVHASKMCPRS